MQASWWRKEEVSMIAEGPADLRRLMIGALSRFRRTCGRLDRVAYLNYLEYRRGAGQDNSGRDQKPMRTKDCGANTPMLAMVSGNSLHSGPRRTDHRGLGPRVYLAWALLLGIVMALSSCATTQVQRAEQIGVMGRTYADAVTLAGDEAMASSIAFSLAEIRKERTGGAFPTPEDRSKALKNQIEILEERQQMVQTSNQALALFAEYFADLEQFAKQDVSTSFETATGGLVESINKIGKAVENDSQAKAQISDAERTSLAKLSGSVARQVHGQALARVLDRDAARIGTRLSDCQFGKRAAHEAFPYFNQRAEFLTNDDENRCKRSS
jgi:hypothetical protein